MNKSGGKSGVFSMGKEKCLILPGLIVYLYRGINIYFWAQVVSVTQMLNYKFRDKFYFLIFFDKTLSQEIDTESV